MNRRVVNDLLLGVTLTFSLFLSVVMFPGLGLATGILTPVPIAFYIRKLGWRYGALIPGVVFLLISAGAGIKVGTIFLAEFAAIGIVLSESVRLRLSLGRGVLLPALTSLAGSVLLLWLVSSPAKGLPAMLEEQIRQNVKEAVEVYSKVGFSEEQIGGLKEFTKRLENIILRTYPSLAFVGILSVTLFNLLTLKAFLKKKGIEDYQVEPTVWRSPELLVWLLIAGGLMLMLKIDWGRTVGLNILIVTASIYFFQGLAIVAFYFKKMGTPSFMRGIGYFLIVFQQIFTILVIGFGLFDLWFDFRRLKKEV